MTGRACLLVEASTRNLNKINEDIIMIPDMRATYKIHVSTFQNDISFGG